MTKQKAISHLNEMLMWGIVQADEYNALKMAIKALEQKPCEDCISRKAALDMAKSYNADGWDSYTPLVVDVEDIEELPPVKPQEPKILDRDEVARRLGTVDVYTARAWTSLLKDLEFLGLGICEVKE